MRRRRRCFSTPSVIACARASERRRGARSWRSSARASRVSRLRTRSGGPSQRRFSRNPRRKRPPRSLSPQNALPERSTRSRSPRSLPTSVRIDPDLPERSSEAFELIQISRDALRKRSGRSGIWKFASGKRSDRSGLSLPIPLAPGSFFVDPRNRLGPLPIHGHEAKEAIRRPGHSGEER